MLHAYFAIFLFLMVGLLIGSALVGFGWLKGKLLNLNTADAQKRSPYECGFDPFDNARMQVDVRYYLVAILFILFDLEVAFMIPWAVVFKELGSFEFFSMLVFLAILVVGFIYEWKKGALEWE